ncbi:unnamed protein product (macronuclear) [Paramecium tetraurelia]|uniref:Trafficking protein particle complex subunit 11 domain-containing protein n=1 Tax=Paramecium tetraurelia TaxID=5888 RepID=A0D8H1_PARTE|nr:uncharacterized protein GSPATT00014284001 [Paramecium tetraurelia]CAK79338.1 unnamed protein product [Paramecium tetraurelia]|eukprot:XP_001446735.1 hypothetical protein (macronuclear) [Paramecium tetraurelia strain d4-2]
MNAFERTLEDMKSIKLLCKKLGDTKQDQLDRMIRIFQSMPQKIYFSNFYQNQLYKNTMGVFSKKDWNSDFVTISVIDQEFQLDWPELMIYMKPFLMFFVIDLQEGLIPIDEINKQKKKVNDDKLIRFLLFNCGVNSFQNTEQEQTFIIIPPLSDDKMVYYLEDQLQLYLCQIIEYFASEILRLKNDQSQLVVFNMKEEKISDQSKLKKRKQGRQIKIMGDLALMINDPFDAIEYYKQALDNLNKNNDYLWCGIVQQHLAASKSSFEEIEEHFRESLTSLKKTKFINLEIECFFKLMQYRKAQNDKLGLNKTIDLFTKTFDPESPIEKCKFYLFVSELYGQIQMKRKQAYFIRLASFQLAIINKSMSLELTKISSTMYGLNSYFSDDQSNIFWTSLQHNFVQEIQHNFQGIPYFQHNTQIQRIQMFKPDFTQQQLETMLQILKQESVKYELKQTYMLMIPKVERLQIIPFKEKFSLINKEAKAQAEGQDIFIVNPWANKEQKNELKYPLNSLIEMVLYISNEYSFDLQLDKLVLEIEGSDCVSYPKGITLLANAKNHPVSFTIRPKSVGLLKIVGIRIQYLNYQYVHRLNQFGYSALLSSETQQQEQQLFNLHNIQIIEDIPNVQASIYRDSTLINEVEAVYFDPSELFTYQFILKNKSEQLIENVAFEIIVESEDPPIYEYKQVIQNFSLDGFSSINVLLSDFDLENQNNQVHIQIPKIPHKTHLIKKISLTLFLWYNNALYQREIKLNRLISIRQRTVIQQCHFVSKYRCNNDNIREIYDLQDSCFLSIQIVKKDFLISLELQSQILIDGQFNEILNEDCEYYTQALKLRKLPSNQLTNPDLKVIWKNLFSGNVGILNPFQHLSQEDIIKHCCNDLIDIECKESNKQIHYKLILHEKLTSSQSVSVVISLTNEYVNTNSNCAKSMVSSVQNINSPIIIEGYTSFNLEIDKSKQTLKNGQLGYCGQLNQSCLKFIVNDFENQRQYIKRCEIK